MSRLEYVLLIGFEDRPDPDDPRPLREQADEQIDGLTYWIGDAIGALAEVLAVHSCERPKEGP